MRRFFSSSWHVFLAMLILVMVALPTSQAYAVPETIPGETCSLDDQFDVPYTLLSPGDGLISSIVSDMHAILQHMALEFYQTIVISESFSSFIPVLLTLYIAIYGIFLTFGLAQITVYDFIVRMFKIGLVSMFVFSWGSISYFWYDFFFYLSNLFNNGTDAIISEVTSIAVGGVSVVYDPAYPFAVIDEVIAKLTSPKMAVTMLATVFTGPYGLIFGTLLLLSAGSFVRSLFMAMWVYLMALILRTLLLALAPIFILFLLFDRTRHLFSGWLNQMVNTCLQPILLFTFFAFFATLISASIENLLQTPVCWTEVPDEMRGGPTSEYFWRFAVRNKDTGDWELFKGIWAWSGAELNPPDPMVAPFPIDIMHILIFLILAELATRFNGIVLMIARDLAGASTDFASMQGPLSTWFSPTKGADDNLANNVGNVGKRNTPGGVYAGPEAAKALNEVKQGIRNQGSGSYVQRISDTLGRR